MIAFILQTLFLALLSFALGWLSGRFIKGLFCQLPSKIGYSSSKQLLKTQHIHNKINELHSTPNSFTTNQLTRVSSTTSTLANSTTVTKNVSNGENNKSIRENKGFDEIAYIISGVSPILTNKTHADGVIPQITENHKEKNIEKTQKVVITTESLNGRTNASKIDCFEKDEKDPQKIAIKNTHTQATIFCRRNMRRFKSHRR